MPNALSAWTAHLFPIGALLASIAILVISSPAYAQDVFEDDDIASRTSWIGLDGVDQTHDFHDLGDKDWARFYVDIDDNPTVTIQTINPGAPQNEFDTFIEIYKDDGTTKLAENDDAAPGSGDLSSFLILNPPETGFYTRSRFLRPGGLGERVWPGYGVRSACRHGIRPLHQPNDS